MFKLISSLRWFLTHRGPPPTTQVSEYLVTEGGGFLMDKGQGAKYAMAFSLRRPITSPLHLTVSFENPSDRRSPFVTDSMVKPDDQEILFRSPWITRFKNGKSYRVVVRLFSDPLHKNCVGTHVQGVFFRLPSNLAHKYGIELF